MIRQVRIKNFKRWREVTFDFPSHVVLAGPNNVGKTTVLQAIAAWDLSLRRWREIHDPYRRKAYTRAPIARQAFTAVPLRQFDLLWSERRASGPIEIELLGDGLKLGMEILADSTEQAYVRPTAATEPAMLEQARVETVFLPAMTGVSVSEPVYQRPKVDELLGLAKPGEVLRNLLVEAHRDQLAWAHLQEAIRRLFGYELDPPDSSLPNILVGYRERAGGPSLDLPSAGSGFQQILMLLAVLYTRPASVLLFDEPDAHLHVILQDAVFSELRSVANRSGSQLIIATHAEAIIDSVEPRDLCLIVGATPRILETVADQKNLVTALRLLSQTDVMKALESPGVLYVEGYTDIDILREWARVLGHPAYRHLTDGLFWRKTVVQAREGAPGISHRDHYEALKLVRSDLPGLVLVDGDARPEVQSTEITGQGLQRLRWSRYEIESYLVHEAALLRFVESKVGTPADESRKAVSDFFSKQLQAVREDPHGEHLVLKGVKASTDILPKVLHDAGLLDIGKPDFFQIAAQMLPEEIHPEVTAKLDLILKAFRLAS